MSVNPVAGYLTDRETSAEEFTIIESWRMQAIGDWWGTALQDGVREHVSITPDTHRPLSWRSRPTLTTLRSPRTANGQVDK